MVRVDCKDVMFGGLSEIWTTGLFSDVEVQIGSRVFQSHKIILCAHSPYFQAMFTNNMKERFTNRVVFTDDISVNVFETLLHFMYHGYLEINNGNVRELMFIADELLMKDLVQKCCDYMLDNLDVGNCVDVMQIAEAHSCTDLKEAALTFTCQNLTNVSMSLSFLRLSVDEVTALLDMKELPCLNEEDVLRAALRWIVHDVVERKKHSFHVLSTVRFRSITVRDLDSAMSSLPVTNDKAFAVVMASLRRDLSTGNLFRYPRFCKPKRGPKYVLLFGGADMNSYDFGTGSTNVYRYDVINDQWLELEQFKLGRYKHTVTAIGNRVYLLGGNHEFFSITSSVECYNITTGAWTSKSSMIECRKAPNVTVVNGRMYVTASEENEDCDPMIEVYDSAEDEWSDYTSSLGWRPANSSTSKVHNDKLYEWVIGNKRGFLRVTPLFLESDPNNRLDIGVFGEADYPHPQLSYVRHKCAMVFSGDYLYLIGGYSSVSEHTLNDAIGKTVDRLNYKTNTWERVASMSAARAGHVAECIDGKIYVFGGQQGALESSYMEIYNPELDTWEPRTQPTNFTFSAAVVY